jgi:hypothetical protein
LSRTKHKENEVRSHQAATARQQGVENDVTIWRLAQQDLEHATSKQHRSD